MLNINAIGPVTRNADENCYILVVIDCFTRFIELYPVSDTSALPCAHALLGHVCRYGTPMIIRSDRGTQFVNGIIKELLDLLQVEHEVKEQNAIVERANREVMRHLTAIVFDKRVDDSWSSDFLPLVQRLMNAKVYDAIGVSPAKLLFGRPLTSTLAYYQPFHPKPLPKA